MGGEGDRATCPACGLGVDREGAGDARLRVVHASGRTALLPAALLARRIEAFGGALSSTGGAPAGALRRARVRVRTAGSEDPVRYRGRLLGFTEALLEGTPAILALDTLEIRLEMLAGGDGSDAPPGDPVLRRWPLESLGSLQTASSTVQFTVRRGAGEPGAPGIVLLRFLDDSPRRWDELLRHALAGRWRALGRGEITEFQPRILARGESK
jgi:hypothetical protein